MTETSFLPETPVANRDALDLRAAIALSQTARERGNRPFGAVIDRRIQRAAPGFLEDLNRFRLPNLEPQALMLVG